MIPRERMLATLNHRAPDRVPIILSFREELIEAITEYYKAGSFDEVVRLLDADLLRYASIATRWKDYEKRTNGVPPGMYASTGPRIMHDARTFEDPWGIVQRVGSDGKYLEWVSGPFAHTDDLDSFPWPGESILVEPPDLREQVAKLKREGWWVIGSAGPHPFKQAWHMRGFENWLCDYVANPEFVEAMYERILAVTLPLCTRSAAAGVDQLEFWGDVSMQDRMLVPPDRWRELDKPVWKRIIDATRKVNRDVRFFFHSDGNLTPIIDDLIEVGFDILNPIQPECVNPAEIKAKWGSRITLHGGGSNQRTLPFGTVADARREAEWLMKYCAYDGGYIFSAANVVSFDCPVENVAAFYETARDFDLSTLTGPPKGKIPEPPCRSIVAHV